MTGNARPILVDLFAGAGGLSLGFEQAGFDVVAAVEYDPIHAATHELNFPYSTVICSDVTRLSGDDIRKAARIGRRTIDWSSHSGRPAQLARLPLPSFGKRAPPQGLHDGECAGHGDRGSPSTA